MSHDNKIIDKDPYFEIDPITRQIKNLSTSKTTLIQFDHNSERFTFSLPRYIEEHDMMESTKAEVHYITPDSKGLYEIEDLQIDPEDSEKVKCTWLLSQNVTKTAGAIRFLLRFSCVADDGTIEYAWNSAPFVGINVSEGIYNTEAIVEQYADVLEQLKNEVVKDLGIISSSELDKITEPGIYVYGGTYNDYYLLSVYADVENGIYRQRKFDLEGSMIREGYSTQSGKIEWSDWVHNGGFDDIPTRLSDLEDDLNIQENIDNKLDKTEFDEYRDGAYATHKILFDEVGKKLERGWEEIGSEVITEYDIAIANGYKGTQEEWLATEDKEAYLEDGNNVQGKGVPCGDLTQYVELMCVVRIPADTTGLNTGTSFWRVGLTANDEKAPDEYSEGLNSGHINGYAQKLQPSKQNEVVIRSYFLDGSHLFSEGFNTDIDSYGVQMNGFIPRIYDGAMGRLYFPCKLEGKTTYWFHTFSTTTKFVLPLGTTIKVYGR